MSMIIGLIIAIITVVIDQITKNLVSSSMYLGESKVLIDKILSITYIHNTGAAYGLFSDTRWIYMALSIIIIVAIPFFYIRFRKFGLFYHISLALIFGGAIGNMIDRVFLGYVIDFIEPVFLPFGKFVDNFADIFVNVGAIMLAIYILFINKTILKSNKNVIKENTESNENIIEEQIENDNQTE